jgi:hypothetical protein
MNSLRHAGQRLGLAVAVAVIVVGRAQGVVHRQQIEQRGDAVQRRVGEPASMLTDPLSHQAMALATISVQATATEARCQPQQAGVFELEVISAAFLEMHRRRLQADHGQLLGAALVLDQAWIIQRKPGQFTLQNSLQLEVIDLPSAVPMASLSFRIDLGGLARFEVNRAGGEVDANAIRPGMT